MNRSTPESRRAGAIIRDARKDMGLTQSDLAELCGQDPNRNYIQQVEQGLITVPGVEQFNKLQQVLNFGGWQFFRELGYKVGDPIEGVSYPLVYALQQLSPEQQRSLIPQVKLLGKYNKDDEGEGDDGPSPRVPVRAGTN